MKCFLVYHRSQTCLSKLSFNIRPMILKAQLVLKSHLGWLATKGSVSSLKSLVQFFTYFENISLINSNQLYTILKGFSLLLFPGKPKFNFETQIEFQSFKQLHDEIQMKSWKLLHGLQSTYIKVLLTLS